ncbi:MAG: DUF2490 domain-containing protein [Bryobacteraceae bacterium]
MQAQIPETPEEFWPEIDVFWKLNNKSRIFMLYGVTKKDNRATYADGSLGVHIDYFGLRALRPHLLHPDKSRNQLAMFRAGYLITRIPSPDGKTSTEHMPTFEAHARAPLPWGLLATDRNRWDLRFVDGVFTPRYRNRLKIERTVKKGWLELTPYAHAEAFYDWRWDKFHRFRYAAGAEWTITSMFVFEAYYLGQRDTTGSPPHVNAIGAALQFYLRRPE